MAPTKIGFLEEDNKQPQIQSNAAPAPAVPGMVSLFEQIHIASRMLCVATEL